MSLQDIALLSNFFELLFQIVQIIKDLSLITGQSFPLRLNQRLIMKIERDSSFCS